MEFIYVPTYTKVIIITRTYFGLDIMKRGYKVIILRLHKLFILLDPNVVINHLLKQKGVYNGC